MKAEEAKTKICPFMPEHLLKFYGSDMCICGGCMAWVELRVVKTEDGYKKSDEDGYCVRLGNE